jgi:transcriptional antiterminator RfaH
MFHASCFFWLKNCQKRWLGREVARLGFLRMQMTDAAWYCARTKPKHEHIAAANLRKYLQLEVFHPRLRMERSTRRGLVRSVEPLFPCYIFVRCAIHERLNDIRYTNGISTIVHFADRIPKVSDTVIAELRECFDAEEPMLVEEKLLPGSEVVLGEGAFSGMRASVLRVMPAGRRVQVLLDILGRPTAVEVDRGAVTLEQNSMADLVPLLAAPRLLALRAA